MARQHHQLNEHEFEQTLGDGGNRRAWHTTAHGGHKELAMT